MVKETMDASKDWAAWAPGLVAALKKALQVHLCEPDRRLEARSHFKKLNVEYWKKHVRAQHQPYRRDCRRCLELAGVDSPHR